MVVTEIPYAVMFIFTMALSFWHVMLVDSRKFSCLFWYHLLLPHLMAIYAPLCTLIMDLYGFATRFKSGRFVSVIFLDSQIVIFENGLVKKIC